MHMSEHNPVRFSLRDFFFIFFSKLYVFLGVFGIIVALVAAYTFSVDSVYKSSATILVKPFIDSRQQVFLLKNQFRINPVSQEDINTEIEILTSRELALSVAEKLGLGGRDGSQALQSDLVSYVRSGLDVSPVTMSNAISIEKKGSNPEVITKIVNTYLDCYVDRHIEVHKSGSGVTFYEKQIQLHDRELNYLKRILKEKQEEWNTIDIKIQNENNIELLSGLRGDVVRVEAQIAGEKEKIRRIKKNIEDSGNSLDLPSEFRADEGLTKFTERIVPLFIEQQKIIGLYPKNSPEVRDVNRQVRYVQNEILQRQKKILRGMITDLESLKKKKALLIEELSKITRESRELAEKKVEQEDLMAKLDQTMAIYKLYMDRFEEARIDEERNLSGVANVSILSRAYVPLKPKFPKKKFMLAAGAVAGSFAGLAAAFIAYYLDHTVKQPKELELLTGVPVLSSVGTLRKRF